MKHENGMMMMREAKELQLAALKQASLGMSDHTMLIGIKPLLKEGDSVPLKLTIKLADGRREFADVNAEVRPITAVHANHDMPDMDGMHTGR